MRGTMLLASAMLALASSHAATDPPFASAVLATVSGELDSASPLTIPDGASAGVLLGPLQAGNDAGTIHDVRLTLSISHPCAGDVAAWLYYDADDDGVYDAETPIEFYLARSEPSLPPAWGCSTTLEGVYHFRLEEAAQSLSDWDTGNFESFRGLPGGGRFYFRVADTVKGDTGSIRGWNVDVD